MKRHRQDSIDATNVDDAIRTAGYRRIRERIELELQKTQANLEGDHDAVRTAYLRGYIRAMRTALDIPAILIREGKQAPVVDPEEKEL